MTAAISKMPAASQNHLLLKNASLQPAPLLVDYFTKAKHQVDHLEAGGSNRPSRTTLL